MITLFTGAGSPFGRKARIAIAHLGLSDRVAYAEATTRDADSPILRHNPLGKMPVLVTDDGDAIYDSPVIVEYLDWLAGGGRILPTEPRRRFAALTLQALSDGLADALILYSYEKRWHEKEQVSEKWLAHQNLKIQSALNELERSPPTEDGVDVGQIAVVCALGYYGRSSLPPWQTERPRLTAFVERFAERVPAFEQTKS